MKTNRIIIVVLLIAASFLILSPRLKRQHGEKAPVTVRTAAKPAASPKPVPPARSDLPSLRPAAVIADQLRKVLNSDPRMQCSYASSVQTMGTSLMVNAAIRRCESNGSVAGTRLNEMLAKSSADQTGWSDEARKQLAQDLMRLTSKGSRLETSLPELYKIQQKSPVYSEALRQIGETLESIGRKNDETDPLRLDLLLLAGQVSFVARSYNQTAKQERGELFVLNTPLTVSPDYYGENWQPELSRVCCAAVEKVMDHWLREEYGFSPNQSSDIIARVCRINFGKTETGSIAKAEYVRMPAAIYY